MVILAVVLAAAAQAGAPVVEEPVRLDPQLAHSRLLKSPSPELPEEATKAWLQGAVVVEYTVGADGRVVSASALGGDPPLTDAAIRAIKKWRYEPLVRDGRPTAFVTTVQVNFPLGRKFWLPELMLREVIESLQSRYEAIREAAATRLGVVFKGKAASGDKRWAQDELKGLLKRERSERVRTAAQQALAALSVETQ